MSDHRVRAVTNHLGHVYSLRTKIDETVLAVPREVVTVVCRPTVYERLGYLLGAEGTATQQTHQKHYGDIAAHIFGFADGDVSNLKVWCGNSVTIGRFIIVPTKGNRYRVYAKTSQHKFMNNLATRKQPTTDSDAVFSARVKVGVDGGVSKRGFKE